MEVSPRQKMCSDLLIGAIEGGTGYWAAVTIYKNDPEYDAWAIIVPEEEDEDWKSFQIDWGTFDRGLKIIAAWETPERKLREDIWRQCKVMNASDGDERYLESVEWDADTCDCVLQISLFGELVYG